MANLHSAFNAFNEEIRLTKSKKAELKSSRDAVRGTVESSLKDKGKNVSFYMQGSIAMETAVNPINGDDYDIDDGVYLRDYDDTPTEEWPSVYTVHTWIRDAVANQTSADVTDKNTCVRIPYQHGYHVDMPIYIMSDGSAHLANKSLGWIVSDAKDFKEWFSGRCRPNDGQLRRIVRFLKRWKDFKGVDLKGIELTILAADNFESSKGHDDDSLRYTVESIIDKLEDNFTCIKPVEPNEDLFEGASESRKSSVLSALRALSADLEFAHNSDSAVDASDRLRKSFGESFPLVEEEEKSVLAVTLAPAVLKRDGRSG